MSTMQTRGPAAASQPCQYLTWRAPSGFWIRRVRVPAHMEIVTGGAAPRDNDRPSILRQAGRARLAHIASQRSDAIQPPGLTEPDGGALPVSGE